MAGGSGISQFASRSVRPARSVPPRPWAKTLREAIFVVALASACSSPAAHVDVAAPGRAPSFTTDEPELVAAVDEMATLLAAATGRADIRLDDGGVPVIFSDNMFNRARGDFDCAQTELVFDDGELVAASIRVDRTPAAGCMPTIGLLIHEAIHALAPEAEHTSSGIFSDRGSVDGSLDPESVARLCESFRCTGSHRPEPVGTGPE